MSGHRGRFAWRRAPGGAAALALLGLLGLLGLLAPGAAAQNAVRFSPDISADLGAASPALVADQQVALDDAAGTVVRVAPAEIAPLPPNADVTAYEPMSGGKSLLSFDITVDLPLLLPPGFPAEPRDVVQYDPAGPAGGSFLLWFDGSFWGVPPGVGVDAVALNEADELLLSFDTTVVLAPVGPVADEDLVKLSVSGDFSLEFDGSANGIAPGLDLDGASQLLGSDVLLLSFDASGIAGGILFDDEDVLAFDTSTLGYAMHFDASLSDPVDWPAADLVALPEPGETLSLLFGVALLAWLERARRRRPEP